MPVQNVECQIATAQIGRYLAGDALSVEIVRQLEAHIAECENCQGTVAERRSALQAMLGEPAQGAKLSATAVVHQPAPKSIAAALQQKVRQQIESRTDPASGQPSAPPAKPMAWKPIAYSGVLAAVLIGMSYFSKNPSLAFGAKAADVLPTVATAPPENPKPHDAPAPAKKEVDSAENHSTPVKPAVKKRKISTVVAHPKLPGKKQDKPVVKPGPSIFKLTRVPPRPLHPARAPRHSTAKRWWHKPAKSTAEPHPTGIRVYDSAGTPIQH